jgi:hypothetical protein
MPRKKKPKIPRQYSMVKFNFKVLDSPAYDRYRGDFYKTFGTPEAPKNFIFFGDIPNMPGHSVIADLKTGKFEFCWHTDYFLELTEDEL